jgi:hypothetical protein
LVEGVLLGGRRGSLTSSCFTRSSSERTSAEWSSVCVSSGVLRLELALADAVALASEPEIDDV